MLKDLVLKNRSYRGFDENFKVSPEILKDLVDVARITASGANAQPLKYRLIFEEAEVKKMNGFTRWGKMLKDMTLPHPGQFPTAYVLIVVDTGICKEPAKAEADMGIAAQTMLLAAVEKELGGCMIGNFDKDPAAEAFCEKPEYVPVLAVAIGKPVETVKLVEVGEDGSTKYYRDENDVHYVPKRKLEDVLI
ncbi:MAG: nitroreductase family protein [Lachnospiraceae bacterium]|nr:nitroreductase family protein [Lachnospiraceae bacterium]